MRVSIDSYFYLNTIVLLVIMSNWASLARLTLLRRDCILSISLFDFLLFLCDMFGSAVILPKYNYYKQYISDTFRKYDVRKKNND